MKQNRDSREQFAKENYKNYNYNNSNNIDINTTIWGIKNSKYSIKEDISN